MATTPDIETKVFVNSLVPSDKFEDSSLTSPRQFISKLLPFHYSHIMLPLIATCFDIVTAS
jgi:hypothetical protein